VAITHVIASLDGYRLAEPAAGIEPRGLTDKPPRPTDILTTAAARSTPLDAMLYGDFPQSRFRRRRRSSIRTPHVHGSATTTETSFASCANQEFRSAPLSGQRTDPRSLQDQQAAHS